MILDVEARWEICVCGRIVPEDELCVCPQGDRDWADFHDRWGWPPSEKPCDVCTEYLANPMERYQMGVISGHRDCVER
jgi:hypothetical protein